MHKEIDEKLRENSSFNIKQEIGSIKSKSAFILKCISFYVFFLWSSFNWFIIFLTILINSKLKMHCYSIKRRRTIEKKGETITDEYTI